MHVRSFALVVAAALSAACSTPPAAPPSGATPLYDNLGSYHHAITTKSPDAQKYFDQGLILSYAFNHAEAIRSFRQAIALDPTCAMCVWGVAFALGPNINAPITEDAAREGYQAIEQARKLAAGASEKERAYIEALAKRYAADPKAERGPLDQAYAAAMREVVKKYPDDLDAAVIFAQSLMDTSPWNYWDNAGNPQPLTNEVVETLESVLARKNDHAGAIHYYIHAVEASTNPGRAEAHADRLPSLMPGAGHIVHMPAHIYLRVGRYEDATVANERAVEADEAYFAGDRVKDNAMYQMGYYPHNIHFSVMSASLEGRRSYSMTAADTTRSKVHADMMRDPGMGGMMQHFYLTPLYMKIRFADWDGVLAEPPPAEEFPFLRVVHHVARGLALAATGRLDQAEAERKAAAALKDHASFPTLFVSSVNHAAAISSLAYEVLEGELAVRRRQADAAVKHFAQAVALEDGLIYMEPPDWPIPVRQMQGAALLELGRAADAEAAFREDMKKFPDNGWSLSGLQASLERQGKKPEAAAVGARLAQAWQKADIKVLAGRPQR
jgi:tetratricopeptide (TPR) repeat protein